MRNWPLIMRKLAEDIEFHDNVLGLGLLLHEIVERLVASEFREHEIDILEEKLYTYLDQRENVRRNYPTMMLNPKPKHHSMYDEFIHISYFSFISPLSYNMNIPSTSVN